MMVTNDGIANVDYAALFCIFKSSQNVIKGMDKDGKECKAKTIKQIKVDPVAPPSIYPNPSSSRIVIETNAATNKASIIQIYSREGNMVYQKDMLIDINKFSIDIVDLPSGFYILKMTNAYR